MKLNSIVIPASVKRIGDHAIGYDTTTYGYSYKHNDFIIYGYSHTAAEKYAKANEFTFISLGDIPGVVYLLGDADGDGEVTILDATAIQRNLVSLPVDEYISEAADADGDNEVSILDATAIQRWLVSLPSNDEIGLPV